MISSKKIMLSKMSMGGSYKFDETISFQTMHHFLHEDKIKLYLEIFDALKADGQYIECDYMIENEDEENFYYNQNRRIRKENNIH